MESVYIEMKDRDLRREKELFFLLVSSAVRMVSNHRLVKNEEFGNQSNAQFFSRVTSYLYIDINFLLIFFLIISGSFQRKRLLR